jgi:hypothetical protein
MNFPLGHPPAFPGHPTSLHLLAHEIERSRQFLLGEECQVAPVVLEVSALGDGGLY